MEHWVTCLYRVFAFISSWTFTLPCGYFEMPSDVDTGGSGGSMNRGPRAPGGPECRATKNLCKKIISLFAYTSGSGKQTTNYKLRIIVVIFDSCRKNCPEYVTFHTRDWRSLLTYWVLMSLESVWRPGSARTRWGSLSAPQTS